jgi:hypothetical protein
MNVKITYSVPIDKVPNKVDELVQDCKTQLEDVSKNLESFSDIDVINKIDTIDTLRKKLASVDFLLEDCYSILIAYNKTIADIKLSQIKKQQERKPDESENN